LRESTASSGRASATDSEAGKIPIATYDPVRMYLREIGKVPLLTAAQEVDLAMRMEGGELAAEVLATADRSDGLDWRGFRRVVDVVVRIRNHQRDPAKKLRPEGIGSETVARGYRPRSRVAAVLFLRRVAADLERARAKLIASNLRLVVSVAKRYRHHGMPLLDLAQEGNLGLMRAVEKFDYRRGFKFSTYATWWIRQAITRAVADQARTIRIPAHVTEHTARVARAQQELAQALGRDPDMGEIGGRVGLPPDRVRQILGLNRDPLSLEAPVGDEDGARIGDFLPDPLAEPLHDVATRTLLQRHVETVLHTLDGREQRVIEMRFGLHDGNPRTLEEVGRAIGVTRERIRQIESKTLCKLRHPSRAEQLHDYVD
jgi:RNA polymerase primary sigma factor